MRAVLHTWFHCGEINAVRQMLGHGEIGFVGDVLPHLDWHSSPSLGPYLPAEAGLFALSECERGLQGLGDSDAEVRIDKADGSQMNAITWTVGHIAMHWHWTDFLVTEAPLPPNPLAFFGQTADPTPPPMAGTREMLAQAVSRAETWLPAADDELLSSKRVFGPQKEERLGVQLLRAVLHTWFHIGEINAQRQLLGHEPIGFVGPMLGRLEWRG
jgi:hypothetical protein